MRDSTAAVILRGQCVSGAGRSLCGPEIRRKARALGLGGRVHLFPRVQVRHDVRNRHISLILVPMDQLRGAARRGGEGPAQSGAQAWPPRIGASGGRSRARPAHLVQQFRNGLPAHGSRVSAVEKWRFSTRSSNPHSSRRGMGPRIALLAALGACACAAPDPSFSVALERVGTLVAWPLRVGSPPAQVSAIVDTGSADLLIRAGFAYNESASSTAKTQGRACTPARRELGPWPTPPIAAAALQTKGSWRFAWTRRGSHLAPLARSTTRCVFIGATGLAHRRLTRHGFAGSLGLQRARRSGFPVPPLLPVDIPARAAAL